MCTRFCIVFLTLSAILCMLHGRTHGSPTMDTNSLTLSRRSLLQRSDPDDGIANPPSQKEAPSLDDEEEAAEAPAEWESRKIGKHHSSDKSVAGGGVIIGGLVTAIFAAVYCYIRVTRTKHTVSVS